MSVEKDVKNRKAEIIKDQENNGDDVNESQRRSSMSNESYTYS